MVTKEEISCQLKQPVKDIADWAFPLSEILERYLQEQNRINFSEAAIVVQNSTSAYVFRLENLYNKITVLQQPLHEKENGKAQRHCGKKSGMDYNFENFHLVDMEKRLGKNIDIKDESDVKDTIKLISRRFPELEDFDVTQTQPPIYIYDVCGEVIGKKYDFRCNYPMDINGTLVDELVPDVPDSLLDSSIKERRSSAPLTAEVHTPGTVSSGYVSSASTSEYHAISCSSPKDSDTNNTTIDQIEGEDLSDDNTVSEALENSVGETVAITSNEVSSEQERGKVNADKEKVITPRKRSERLKNMQAGSISKITNSAPSKPSAPAKAQKSTVLLKSVARRRRKRKHPDSRSELNDCTQSVQDLLKNVLCYKAVEDNRLNLLGFRCSNSVTEELEHNTSELSQPSSPVHIESRASSVSPDVCMDLDRSDMSFAKPDYQSCIEDKMNAIVEECDVKTEWELAVADWHRSLQPKLLEAEERATFDIQQYESEIVSNLEAAEGKKCDFDHLVANRSSYEVSRYFLASLHLANAYNIEINHKDEVGMEMTLLRNKTK